LFGLLGEQFLPWKLSFEVAAIIILIVLNLRGVKESVMVLLPIFILFLITHAVIIVGVLGMHALDAGAITQHVASEVSKSGNNPNFGLWAMLGLLLHAYSMGAGTYTGIEAVSNSMPVMREPRVITAKKTMVYMAVS